MYKMLVLDIDGTLLNDDHEISKENFEAIQDAADRGVKIILASGRTAAGIDPYLKELNLITNDNYYIACSGAIIQNNTRTKIIGTTILNVNDLRYVYNIAKELNIGLSVYTYDGILTFSRDLYSRFDALLNNVPLQTADFNMLDEDLMITKICLIDDGVKGLKRIKEFFSGVQLPDAYLDEIGERREINIENDVFEDVLKLPSKLLDKYTVVKSLPFSIEIIRKDCNKWEAVKKIAEKLDIMEEEIICVGDSENDIHMIENAGLGVAMGNAFSNVKEVSDFITYTNEQNGVAHVINKFILQEKCLHMG